MAVQSHAEAVGGREGGLRVGGGSASWLSSACVLERGPARSIRDGRLTQVTK